MFPSYVHYSFLFCLGLFLSTTIITTTTSVVEAFVATTKTESSVQTVYRHSFMEWTRKNDQTKINHVRSVIASSSSLSSLLSMTQQVSDDSSSLENSVNDNQLIATPMDRPLLACLDFVTFLLFAAIGKASHTSTESAFLEIQSIMLTAAPFIVAWYMTSPFTKVYYSKKKNTNETNYMMILDSIQQTAKGWIIAVPIGCILRGIMKGYIPPLPFVIVTMISTLVLLGFVRLIFALVEKRIINSS
jgi:Protein of unknown function (DUF3054)